MDTASALPPDIYTRDYFLKSAGGYELYQLSRGNRLPPRQQWAFELADPKAGETVLDMGCGRGEITYQCAKAGCKVIAVDFSQAAVEITKETLQPLSASSQTEVYQKDIGSFKFNKNYDLVFLLDVVEHLTTSQLQEFFSRMRPHLNSGARIVIHTDNVYYETCLFPLKRALSLPFTIITRISKAIRGKRKEYAWKAWFRRTFEVFPPRDLYETMHINLYTPSALKKFLQQQFPQSRVEIVIRDNARNLVSKLLSCWWGKELYAIIHIASII